MKITIMIISGITVIGALETIALLKGINGVALSASIGAIAAILTGAPSYLAGRVKGKKEAGKNGN